MIHGSFDKGFAQARKKVLIVAGEASGDLYGGELILEVSRLIPSVAFYGIGGERMRAAGLYGPFRSDDVSVVGFFEVFRHIKPILRALNFIKKSLRDVRPDLVILIDFPDFNFRVARAAKKADIPVLYYVSPQVWAWRRGRAKTLARTVNKMIVLFPFEVAIYKNVGLDVEFLGHPIMDIVSAAEKKITMRREGNPCIALLPGSRRGEIKQLMPALLRAGDFIKEKYPDVVFLIPLAPTLTEDDFLPYIEKSSLPLRIIKDDFHGVVKNADFAIVCSGTATLETALLGTPMVVVYRLNPLTFLLARLLIRVRFIALVNLVAERLIVPELIQNDATPENIARYADELLSDEKKRKKMLEGLAAVRRKIGEPGATKRIAGLVRDILLG